MEDIAQPFFHEDVDISSHDANFVPIDNDLQSLRIEGCRIAHPRGTSRSLWSKGEGLHCTDADSLRGKKTGGAFVYYEGDILSPSDAGRARSPAGNCSLAMSLGEDFPVGQDWQAGKSEEKHGQHWAHLCAVRQDSTAVWRCVAWQEEETLCGSDALIVQKMLGHVVSRIRSRGNQQWVWGTGEMGLGFRTSFNEKPRSFI